MDLQHVSEVANPNCKHLITRTVHDKMLPVLEPCMVGQLYIPSLINNGGRTLHLSPPKRFA